MIEKILVFIAVPAAILVVIIGGIVNRRVEHDGRYRPGRPFAFAPLWLFSTGRVDPASEASATDVTAAVASAAGPMADFSHRLPARFSEIDTSCGGASAHW